MGANRERTALLTGSSTIRRMRKEDVDEVIKLAINTKEIKTGTGSPQFYSKKTLLKWINGPSDILLVAKKQGNVVGFSLAAYNPYSRDGYLHVSVVREENREEGIGSEMLKTTLETMARQGCNHVFAMAKPDNVPILNLLRKHGFEVGEQFNYVERTL